MTTVGCAPPGTTLPSGIEIPFVLYGSRPNSATGGIGSTIPSIVNALGLQPSSRAWDFLSISLAVVAADESCTRSKSPDGWTRKIDLTIAVIDPTFWSGVTINLQQALRFVTGDIWNLTFIGGGFLPAPPKPVKTRPEDAICLLSGGMDSLIGAIDLCAIGQKPLLVSQVAKGDKFDQQRFAKAIAPNCLHVQINHNASPPVASERSQRGRSLVFFGLGVLAATCLKNYASGKEVDMFVPENGFISLNVPLTALRLGSLSTRTTHPHYLEKLQSILDLSGIKVRLKNPYQYKTKGEMLDGCLNQALLKQLIGSTTSCGRYARTGFKQCGRCVPCLVRRAAFHKWIGNDLTSSYKYELLGTPGKKFRDFDDVRSVACAVYVKRKRGLNAWVGGTLNSAMISDAVAARGVAERGIEELGDFLTVQGVI
ncbi:Qat anti-phage system QueC-like protein QatC [Sphingobium sp. AN641]|uniref:Qat anti-phage system QueC-like protein QatC n=1 Tax=Sphingobium sp. AN641 TaxID=3133443 RepID=UPI0030C00C80